GLGEAAILPDRDGHARVAVAWRGAGQTPSSPGGSRMPPRPSPPLPDLLALSLLPGLRPRLTPALFRHFCSAGAARRPAASQLRQVPQIGAKLSEDFATALAAVDVDAEIALLDRHDTTVIALGDAGYPAALAQAPAPLPLLYVSGSLTAADAKAIA